MSHLPEEAVRQEGVWGLPNQEVVKLAPCTPPAGHSAWCPQGSMRCLEGCSSPHPTPHFLPVPLQSSSCIY